MTVSFPANRSATRNIPTVTTSDRDAGDPDRVCLPQIPLTATMTSARDRTIPAGAERQPAAHPVVSAVIDGHVHSTARSCYVREEGFRSGSNADWEAFYETTQHKLRGAIGRAGLRSADIDDVLQETYLRVFERRESIDLTRNVVAYVTTTAHHIAIDRYRHERRCRTIEITDVETTDEQGYTALDRASSPASVEDAAIADVEVDLVAGILSEMSPKQRVAVLLSAVGYSLGEVAHLTNAPLGTVKTRHRLGKAHLRSVLDGHACTLPTNSAK